MSSALLGCKYDTFLEAFEALQVWVIQHSNRKLETAFNALVAPLHNEDYNLKRDVEDFTWLCGNAVGDFPLLEQYLNHIHSDETAPDIYEVVLEAVCLKHNTHWAMDRWRQYRPLIRMSA